MKKNCYGHGLKGHFWKLLFVMKLTILFYFLGLMSISASTYSQSKKFSMNLESATLFDVFQEIESQSEFVFIYKNEAIDLNKKVNLNVVDLTVDKVLETVLKDAGVKFEINDKQIIITPDWSNPERKVDKNAELLQQPEILKKIISGSVTDQKGGQMPGVTIIVKGTTIGTTTDIDGKFRLSVPTDAKIIVFSFVGTKAQELPIAGKTTFNVVLTEEVVGLDDVVVVAYGTQKKISSTGSQSSVSNKEIVKAPVADVANALTGLMPGLTVVNNSGHVGMNNTVIRLRGIGTMSGQLDPLIMVDGMESPMNDIDPNEIESVTILKDASSTAVFGVRGANGVILITTKRGNDGPAKVNFIAEYGISTRTRKPQFLNSEEYATLYDEAQINDGVNPANVKYSASAIQHFKAGDDPWLYPNTDWQKMMMRDISPQERYNLNISGGTKSSKYYVSAGYLSQTGIWKNFNAGYDNSDWSKRYNFRSNVDIDVTKSMAVSVNLSGMLKEVNYPNGQRSTPSDEDWQFFRYLMSSPPMAGAGWINGKSYMVDGYDTPIKWMTGKGYEHMNSSQLNAILGINQKLDFITRGLSARAKYGYDSNYTINLARRITTPEYAPVRQSIDTNGDGIAEDLLLFKQIGTPSVLTYSEDVSTKYPQRRHIYVEAGLDWKRTAGRYHDFTGLLLYNQSKKYYTESAFNEIPLSYMGFVGRFTYSYKSKYNAEVNMGYNGSENFPANKRFGFLPAFSASWVVSEERFMKRLPFISFLKLRASYGKVGNDKLGSNRFLYIPDSYSMTYNDGPVFGVNGSGQKYGIASLIKRGNPDVTWEIDEKQNYGFQAILFNKLTLNFDYFYDFRSNILGTKRTYTSYVDDKIPPLNFGKMSNHGYEIEATWKETKGNFGYWIKGIYAFARNKVLEMDEPSTIPDWQKQTGRPYGCPVLYLVKGFYETQEQVDAANGKTTVEGVAYNTLAGGNVRKGDLWYVDYNKDDKIDDLDRVAYGNYTLVPEITGSLSLGFSYKGFDCSALFQGVTHAVVSYGAESLQPFTSQFLATASAQTFVRGRWTEATKETATFPALTLVPGQYDFGGPYGYSNSFFTDDASYIRLKNVEFGYTFSGNLLKRMKCHAMRIYVNGSNLLTWDKQKLFKFDPEQPGGRGLAYPQQTIYNLGVNLQF